MKALLTGLSLGLLAGICLGGQGAPKQLSPFPSIYKWFDGLDFDAVRDGQFVTFRWNSADFPISRREYGFETASGSVLSLYLQRPLPGDKITAIEPEDIRRFADQQIHLLRTEDPQQSTAMIAGPNLFLIMARACSARGLDEEGRFFQDWLAKYGSPAMLPNRLKTVIVDDQLHFFTMRFKRTDLPWTYQLTDAQRLAREFGDTERGLDAREAVEAMELVVHPRPLPESADEVDRLIRQLPDEQALEYFMTSEPELRGDPRTKTRNNAAYRLAAKGYQAVPKLIDALTDRRFTHTVAGFMGQEVYRVGGLAAIILRKITGQDFVKSAVALDQGAMTRAQAQARTWWAKAGQAGEFENLPAALSSPNSFEAAQTLQAKYPTRASEAIGRAIDGMKQTSDRSALISLLALDPDPAALAILRRDAESGADAKLRVDAAQGLLGSLPSLAEGVLVSEWHKYLASGSVVEADTSRDYYRRDELTLEGFIPPLVLARRARTLDCLDENFQQRSPFFRREVVQLLLNQAIEAGSKEYGEAVERILAKASGDETFASPVPRIWAPTVGDLACLALSRYLPSKYELGNFRFRSERVLQAAKFYNVWLASSGELTLPLPPILRSLYPPVPTDTVEEVSLSHARESTKPVQELAESMRTKRLTVDQIGALLKTCVSRPTDRARSIYVTIARERRGGGLTIRVNLDEPAYWHAVHGRVEGIVDLDGHGTISGGIDISSFDKSAWAEPIEKCLKSDGDTPFTIRFTVTA